MDTIYVFFADGFEEMEAFASVDILRRAGLKVEMVSVTPDEIVRGAHGVPVLCDKNIADCQDAYDVIVIPGGLPGSEHCRDCAPLIALLKQQQAAGRFIAAICAAPGFVLAHHGIITDKVQATGYPGCADNIKSYVSAGVVYDKDAKIITGKGPAFSLPFAYQILTCVAGEAVTAQVKAGMHYTD